MRLDRMGITIVFPCVFYGYFIKTTNHLLLQCYFAQNCWKWLRCQLECHAPLSNDLLSQFQGWPNIYKNAMFSCIWEASPFILMWNLC